MEGGREGGTVLVVVEGVRVGLVGVWLVVRRRVWRSGVSGRIVVWREGGKEEGSVVVVVVVVRNEGDKDKDNSKRRKSGQ